MGCDGNCAQGRDKCDCSGRVRPMPMLVRLATTRVTEEVALKVVMVATCLAGVGVVVWRVMSGQI